MFKFFNEMKDKFTEIIDPINHLSLYGFKRYFDFFTNLYQKRKLPNCILLSGQKGIGKSTFAFHFSNNSILEASNFNSSLKLKLNA